MIRIKQVEENKGTGVAVRQDETLPALIDRAASALSSARTSAEVLEALHMVRVAYDAARSAVRMARAKKAHDVVIEAVYRAQADAAVIEARAKVRLADEYDAAQARGEVATRENNPGSAGHVGGHNMPPATAADLGLRRDEIHEARKLRDAEAAQPGRIEAAAKALVERGKEPTKAALRREVIGATEPAKTAAADPDAAERRALARLTVDALIDEVIGLKADLADARKSIAERDAELRDLRSWWEAANNGTDTHRALATARRRVKEVEGRLGEIAEQLAREKRRANGFERRVKELQARLEMQEIPLGPVA